MKIAYLILKRLYFRSDRKSGREGNEGFESYGYFGLFYIINKLKPIQVAPCSELTAKEYDVVLVSLTSAYDVLAFAKQVSLLKSWQPGERKFKVIAGGAGCVNIYGIKDFIDYAFFGRIEGIEKDIILNQTHHESLMDLSKGIYPVKMRQPQNLICVKDVKSGTKKHDFVESSTGCVNKCYYCHYTFARKALTNEFENNSLQFNELDYFKIERLDLTKPYIITAIDGSTERIRSIYNRNLSDEQIREFMIKASEKTSCKALILQLYTITGMEGEKEGDFEKMINNLSKADKYLKKRITIKLKVTPFRPSPLTPSQYSKVGYLNLHRKYGLGMGIKLYNSGNLMIMTAGKFEKQFKQVTDLSVLRCSEKTKPVFDIVTKSTKFYNLMSDDQLKYLQRNYDLNELYREYSIGEKLPTWFLESYIPNEKIKKMRLQMLKKMA